MSHVKMYFLGLPFADIPISPVPRQTNFAFPLSRELKSDEYFSLREFCDLCAFFSRWSSFFRHRLGLIVSL